MVLYKFVLKYIFVKLHYLEKETEFIFFLGLTNDTVDHIIVSSNPCISTIFWEMDRQKVTYPLTYFASDAQACHKPAILLEDSPNKPVFP